MSDNQQFCLRWNNHQSTLVQVIDSLLSSGVLVDCTLAAEGQYLHAHKVVLCACSPYLETLLSQHYEKHPIVILKDVKFQELKSMMDYMYKGEVNISQDQLGQFLKAAESLQIKGLTDGGSGENDTRDVGSTTQKRHEPAPVRKTIPHNQSRSPVVLPSHSSGLTIEPSKRSLPTHLSESQPDSPIRSREGSTSPTSRKRRRTRRTSQGDEDSHADNSCDLPMTSQSMSITSVPSSIPPLPSGSSSTITKAPPPDEDSENPESDRISGLPEGLIKEKIEPQSEMLIEPKTEYMDETNNDDSVEDLTLDDDDDYENMMEGGAGPSHSANNPNDNYAAWQQITGDRQDDAYLNPTDSGHRDSQGFKNNASENVEIQHNNKSKDLLEIDNSTNSGSIDELEKSKALRKPSKQASFCSNSGESDNMKNSKKRFTPFQVDTLKYMFQEFPYITQSQAASIARQTGLKKLQVRKWFSDYRCKIKRQSARLEQCSSSSSASQFVEERRKSNRIPKKRIMDKFDTELLSDEDEDDVYAGQITQTVRKLTVAFSKRSRKKTKKRDTDYVPKRYKKTVVDHNVSHKVKRFSPFQVDSLKKEYTLSPYITQREAAVIARRIGLKKMQVRKWFCDYRCKMKKQSQQQFHQQNEASNLLVNSDANPQLYPKCTRMQGTKGSDDAEVEEIDDTCVSLANGIVDEKASPVKVKIKHLQKRTFRFTEMQLKVLNEEFDKSQFLTEEKLNLLCIKLKERRERIQTWFKMRRYKLRQSEQKFWQNIIG